MDGWMEIFIWMSHKPHSPAPAGLRTESCLELTHLPILSVRVAARMLWATIDSTTGSDLGVSNYESFLDYLVSNCPPNVLNRLDPVVVMYYVHLAAGLSREASSLVVWVWDELNAVKLEAGQDATFMQEHLSEVVICRQAALTNRQTILDVLMVPVVASTRGSAVSLAPTASKKAGYRDLR